jgi:hypothetical protein
MGRPLPQRPGDDKTAHQALTAAILAQRGHRTIRGPDVGVSTVPVRTLGPDERIAEAPHTQIATAPLRW